MSEHLLITHCSPTLAGMKTGNLFSCSCKSAGQLRSVVSQWNAMLNPKGVYIKVMRFQKKRVLLYVYRRNKLMQEIGCREIREFLREQGYECLCSSVNGCGYDICDEEEHTELLLEQVLLMLARRLSRQEEFPHEIGVFLGYPFEDVKGFIENKGKHYKLAGPWKVYSDEAAARKMFSKYKKCTDVYCQCMRKGKDLMNLTVEGRHLP